MTPLFPAQRAAEEFDQVLSGTADEPLPSDTPSSSTPSRSSAPCPRSRPGPSSSATSAPG